MITREEALNRVKGYLTDIIPIDDYSEVEEIVKALEQEPSEDCIARQPLIDNWNHCADMLMGEGDAEVVMEWIFDAPSVNPQKIGHWIENAPEYQNIDPPYICSECGNMHLRKTNYCDQCGAEMVEPQESEVKDAYSN